VPYLHHRPLGLSKEAHLTGLGAFEPAIARDTGTGIAEEPPTKARSLYFEESGPSSNPCTARYEKEPSGLFFV
jgi:hypothetical protein